MSKAVATAPLLGEKGCAVCIDECVIWHTGEVLNTCTTLWLFGAKQVLWANGRQHMHHRHFSLL